MNFFLDNVFFYQSTLSPGYYLRNLMMSSELPIKSSLFSFFFLGAVALLYFSLSVWCTLDPQTTSDKVGFQRIPGAGESEFLVIYGGLEMAMALMFAMPLLRRSFLLPSLFFCFLIHLCLVVYRSASFAIYSDIPAFTYQLAIGEWIILLMSMLALFLNRDSLLLNNAAT